MARRAGPAGFGARAGSRHAAPSSARSRWSSSVVRVGRSPAGSITREGWLGRGTAPAFPLSVCKNIVKGGATGSCSAHGASRCPRRSPWSRCIPRPRRSVSDPRERGLPLRVRRPRQPCRRRGRHPDDVRQRAARPRTRGAASQAVELVDRDHPQRRPPTLPTAAGSSRRGGARSRRPRPGAGGPQRPFDRRARTSAPATSRKPTRGARPPRAGRPLVQRDRPPPGHLQERTGDAPLSRPALSRGRGRECRHVRARRTRPLEDGGRPPFPEAAQAAGRPHRRMPLLQAPPARPGQAPEGVQRACRAAAAAFADDVQGSPDRVCRDRPPDDEHSGIRIRGRRRRDRKRNRHRRRARGRGGRPQGGRRRRGRNGRERRRLRGNEGTVRPSRPGGEGGRDGEVAGAGAPAPRKRRRHPSVGADDRHSGSSRRRTTLLDARRANRRTLQLRLPTRRPRLPALPGPARAAPSDQPALRSRRKAARPPRAQASRQDRADDRHSRRGRRRAFTVGSCERGDERCNRVARPCQARGRAPHPSDQHAPQSRRRAGRSPRAPGTSGRQRRPRSNRRALRPCRRPARRARLPDVPGTRTAEPSTRLLAPPARGPPPGAAEKRQADDASPATPTERRPRRPRSNRRAPQPRRPPHRPRLPASPGTTTPAPRVAAPPRRAAEKRADVPGPRPRRRSGADDGAARTDEHCNRAARAAGRASRPCQARGRTSAGANVPPRGVGRKRSPTLARRVRSRPDCEQGSSFDLLHT